MRRLFLAGLALLLVAPPDASAHSLVGERGGRVLYLVGVRVTCSERCFVHARRTRRGATVAQATAALAGPGATYVFLRGRVALEVTDAFGNAVRR